MIVIIIQRRYLQVNFNHLTIKAEKTPKFSEIQTLT